MAQQLIPALPEDEVCQIVGRMMKAGLLTDCFKNGDGTGWYIGFPTGHAERHAGFELVAGVASVGKHAV